MYSVPEERQRPQGMFAFTIVWLGQLVSLVGSSMTGFAMTLWAWQITGKATALALVGFFAFAPSVIMSPIAGALVDRWNRKLVMMLSDLAAGMSTIVTLLLYNFGLLQVWHLYILASFVSVFQAFQWPAYSAAISTMLPKKHYARANGMMSMAESGASIVAPMTAGFILAMTNNNIAPILIIDIVSFCAAITALLFVAIPQPKESAEGAASKGSLWKEAGFGFRYILARPSLLGMQLVFFAVNFIGGFQFTMVTPMILARTNSNATALGIVEACLGIGGFLGGLAMSIWGGPKRRVNGVLIGMMLTSFSGGVLMGLGQTTWVWATAAFLTMMVMPVLNGSNQAIWQSKVPPDLQGRVFSVRRLIAQISSPVAILMVGPLVDKILEPQMQSGGSLAGVFGGIVGTGRGSGMALMLILSGMVGIGVGLAGYLFPAVRNIETLIPDHSDSAEEPSDVSVVVGELQPAD